jgi:uncharacterized protein (AIM24 family)
VGGKAYVPHLTKGGELLRAEKLAEARVELERANELKPGDHRILNLLGLAYFKLGEYAQAKKIYTDLVEKQPSDASLRLNLGLVYLRMGAPDEAIVELNRSQELDPKQSRAAQYLGLAYARKGQLERARDAFRAAGQEDLAREMEAQLAQEQAGAAAADGAAVAGKQNGKAADGSAGAAAMQEASPTAISDEETSGPVLDVGAVGAVIEDEEGDAETDRAVDRATTVPPPIPPDASAPRHVEIQPSGPSVSAPAPATTIEVGSEGKRPPFSQAPAGAWPAGLEGHRAPLAVSQFATERLIRPDDGDLPFELAAGGTLIVRVRGKLMSRTEGVIVSGGELSYEPATKRVRGRTTEEAFGTEQRPMFIVSGTGHLVAAPSGGTFTALELQDDIVYLREQLVFAFEEHLGWENGHVPGSGASIDVVQFRGQGCVVLRTRRPPISVKLAPEKVLYVDAAVLAGWIGRVVPRVVAPAAGGDASAPFVECTGEGVVLIEEPLPPEEE